MAFLSQLVLFRPNLIVAYALFVEQPITFGIASHLILSCSYATTLFVHISIFHVACPSETRRLLGMYPRVAFNALVACLFMASLASSITSDSFYEENALDPDAPKYKLLLSVLINDAIPGYKQLMSLAM